MTYRVMKFGGTSVGSAERLANVVELVARERTNGPIAVVVSAMGDTTDHLIEAAKLAAKGEADAAERVIDRVADVATVTALMVLQNVERAHGKLAVRPETSPTVRELLGPLRKLLHGVSLLRECTAQTLDLVMSFGERLSASLIAEILNARGVSAVFVDARDWMVTDDRFGAAIIDWDATRARLEELEPSFRDKVSVHTGFIGKTKDGRTTTLGRNGSDYTATLLARGLCAEEVVIWTDVSGVMTADPALVSDAYPIAHMSYLEALELATFGARMFHPRTMIPLIESSIPMRIRNTMHLDAPGTRIDAGGQATDVRPTCVTSLENLALLDVRWRRLSSPEALLGERVLRALDAAEVTVWMCSQAAHGQAVAVVIPAAEVERARAAVARDLALEIERKELEPIGVRAPVTLLSLVEERMHESKSVPGRFFGALGAVGVQICAIAQGASSRSVSCAIEAADTAVAVRAVHAAFNFSHQKVSLLVLGRGTVGGQLLQQIRDQRETLSGDHGVRLDVVGIATRQGTIFDERGVALELPERKAAPPGKDGPPDLAPYLDKLCRLPVPVLVDCSAAGGMEDVYEQAFRRGIHVVSANKKPLTIPWARRRRLMEAARANYRAYHYETTVGASLPVIETLKNLVRTGDRVHLIEGSLSGTLGYLTNEVTRGVALSKAVERAKELGYTEPVPQDDLSGLDVARKALILARELGLELELDDIEVEPLVPRAIIEEREIDAFFRALERHDSHFGEQIDRLRADGRVLRYLVRVDPHAGGKRVAKVGPVGIELAHPASRLRGSEAFVAFTTERYSDYPLIVQGAGAGGAVTAAGVLADVLRIAQNLRGR